MRTTPEGLAALVDNQRRVVRTKVKLDHIPTTEELLGLQLREAGISYTPQYLFHPRRLWRADFGIPYDTGLIGRPWLLVEVNGNGTNGHPGAHRSIKGYEDDCEREIEAMMLGYQVLRVPTHWVKNGKAIFWIKRLLDARTMTNPNPTPSRAENANSGPKRGTVDEGGIL